MKKRLLVFVTTLSLACCMLASTSSGSIHAAPTCPVAPNASGVCPVSTTPEVAPAFDPFAKVCEGTTTDSSVCKDKDNKTNPIYGADGILLKAARILAIITGVASVIIILFGSIKYVTASTRDKGESIASAKSTIIYAFVGLIVALLAQGLIVFVLNRLN